MTKEIYSEMLADYANNYEHVEVQKDSDGVVAIYFDSDIVKYNSGCEFGTLMIEGNTVEASVGIFRKCYDDIIYDNLVHLFNYINILKSHVKFSTEWVGDEVTIEAALINTFVDDEYPNIKTIDSMYNGVAQELSKFMPAIEKIMSGGDFEIAKHLIGE